jgi:hypothetical protein
MVLDSDIEKEQPRLAATKEFTTKIANQERTVLESELKTDPTWIKAYKTIHKTQYGTEAEGTDEELSANALNFMADTVYPIATVNGDGLALVYNRFKDAPAEEQAALYYMIDTMEKKDITGRGVKAAFKALGKDPTTYLGLTGVGFFGKAAARETAKKGLIQMLKMGIKSNMGQAAMAGGAYLGGEEAVLQDLKVGAGIQEDINWEDVGVMTGMGAGFGATITAAMPYIMKATGMTVKEIGRFIKERGGEILDTPLGDVITGLQRIVPNEAPMPKEAPQFYSQLETALTETNQKTWNKAQLEGFLAKQGVKTEEMKWSGIQEYLDGLDDNAKVTTQELMDMVNQPQLEKTTLHAGQGKALTGDEYSAQIQAAERQGDWDTAERLTLEWEDLELQGSLPGGDTKYHDYTVKDADGTNYREELTTLKDNKLPDGVEVRKEDMGYMVYKNGEAAGFYEDTYDKAISNIQFDTTQYKSSHWDESNVLYHVRKQDVEIDGDNTMLIEEIQSDWHQAGRKKGYKTEFTKQEETIWKDYENIWEGISNDEIDLTGISGHTNMDKALELTAKKHNISIEEVKNITKFKENGIVPQAPYSKTWHEKAMKDQIAEAVETGKDRVAWVAGKEQAQRYSLSKQVDEIKVSKVNERENRRIFIVGETDIMLDVDKTGKVIRDAGGSLVPKEYLGKNIDDILGKEMSQKIMNSDTKNRTILKGKDLEIGGEGMKGFYDQMLPKWTDKYIKKYDSKVEVKKLANGQEVWSFKVTDKMKKELKGKGQALYSGAAGVGIAASQQEDNK